jgi:hypothetical protein
MMGIRIALVGCGKLKSTPRGNDKYMPARELYIGDLFRKRAECMDSRDIPWYVVSAKGGLIKPTTMVGTYDKTIDDLTEIEKAEWHVGIANQLLTELYYEFNSPKLSSIVIELHAGKQYCEPLATILGLLGIKTIKPVEGLGIGEQLAHYKSMLTGEAA